MYILFRSEDVGQKLPLSREIVDKGSLGPPIFRGRGYNRFRTLYFQIAVTSEQVAGFG